MDGILGADGDCGADPKNTSTYGVPVGGVVGGGLKREDCISCHQAVKDEEAWV